MISILFGHLKGLRALSQLWFGLYLLKMFCAALIVIPLFLVTNSVLGISEFSRTLLYEWDLSVIGELFRGKPDLMPYFMISMVSGTVLYVIVMQFFNGGIYYLVVSGEIKDIDWRKFFAECGQGFRAQLFITVLMIPLYLLIGISGIEFANLAGIIGGDHVGSVPVLIMMIKLGIIGLILLMTSVFSDSARSSAAAHPDKTFREILKIASDYFRSRFFKMSLAYLVTFFPFVLIWLAVEGLALVVIGTGLGFPAVAVEFILFQISSLMRNGQKIWYLLFFGREFREVYHGRFIPQQVELKFDS